MSTSSNPVKLRITQWQEIDDNRLTSKAYNSSSYDVTLGPNEVAVRNVVPNWRDRILRDQDASSPYKRTFYKNVRSAVMRASSCTLPSGPTASYRIRSKTRSVVFGTWSPFGTTDSALRDLALSRFKAKLRGSISQYNLLVPAGEARELQHLVGSLAGYTSKTLQAIKDLKRGNLKKTIRQLQDTWLTYSFGIKPLLSDIHDLGESLASYLGRQDKSVRHSGSAKKNGSSIFVPTDVVTAPFGCKYTPSGTSTYELSYRCIGAYDLSILSSARYGLDDHLGINLESVPSALWELTCLSWIADYFVNIGPWLDDVFYSPPGQSKYIVMCRRYAQTVSISWRCSVIPGNPNNVLIDDSHDDVASLEYIEFEREVLTSLPHGGLHFRSFDQIAQNAVGKVLNLVSLLKPKH